MLLKIRASRLVYSRYSVINIDCSLGRRPKNRPVTLGYLQSFSLGRQQCFKGLGSLLLRFIYTKE